MADAADALQSAQTGVDVRLDERKMYVVEWADGAAFGFTVTPVQSDRGTVLCLARRTATSASAGLQDVMPGDMLIAIGDEKVYHLGAGNATKLLRSVQKPVRLTLQLSPYGSASKDLPAPASNEYTYLWESGPLGIVLTTDPKSKLPLVKRFTGKADSPALERDVSVGDELVYVNQTPTSDHSISAIISIIKELPKPITLRFRKPLADELHMELPELGQGEYDFLWEYGSLGLVVGTSAEGLPYVRSFTGKGTSKQLAQVQENDEIILVNNRSAKEHGFHETMQYIMNVPKPAVIRFRRPLANRAKAGTPPKPTESAALTAQMSSMSVGTAPQPSQAPPPVRSASTSSAPPAAAHVRSYSSSRSNSSVEENEAAPGLLGYRSARSNSSFTMSRHQHASKYQMQPPVQVAEDLSFGHAASHSQPQQQQSYQQAPPQPQQQSYPQAPPQQHSPYQPSPLQQQQSFQQSQTYQQPLATPQMEEEDFFEVDTNAYYQIQWTDGPFGFTVREAQSKQGSVVLVTKRTGKSTCAGLRRVAVGDILIKIGDKDVRQLGFERSTMHLRNVAKPVVLTFQAID
jgi:C-terminal processing protease CtpA/Prc